MSYSTPNLIATPNGISLIGALNVTGTITAPMITFPDGSTQGTASSGSSSDPQTLVKGLTANAITSTTLVDSSLTSGRVPFITVGGRFTDTSGLTFDGNSLLSTNGMCTSTLVTTAGIVAAGTIKSSVGGFVFPDNTIQSTASSTADPLTIVKGITTNALTATVLSATNPSFPLGMTINALTVTSLSATALTTSGSTVNGNLTVTGTITDSLGLTTNALTTTTLSATSPSFPLGLTVNALTATTLISTNGATVIGSMLVAGAETNTQGISVNALTATSLMSTNGATVTGSVLIAGQLNDPIGITTNALTGTSVTANALTTTSIFSTNGLTSLSGNLFASSIQFSGNGNGLQTAPFNNTQITFTIDGGSGALIARGDKQAYFRVPFNATISGWEIATDASGFIAIDVWKVPGASFPPTVSNSIVSSTPPKITSGRFTSSTTLTGWTTTLNRGDYLNVNVNAATVVSKVILTLLTTPS